MRYTLLKHTIGNDFHVDFLLECGAQRLLTWQIDDEKFLQAVSRQVFFSFFPKPSNDTNNTIELFCRRIFDHRPVYLDYEGEINGNRGFVEQLDIGDWEVLDVTKKRIALKSKSCKKYGPKANWECYFPETVEIDPMLVQQIDVSAEQAGKLAALLSILPAPGEAKWRFVIKPISSGKHDG